MTTASLEPNWTDLDDFLGDTATNDPAAFYAQMRRLEISAVKAMFGTYVLLSLPYLTIHVALAGYADIFVAIAYGLAAMSSWQWTMTRQRDDAILAVVMAIICASLKQEGLLWVLTLICGVPLFARSWGSHLP